MTKLLTEFLTIGTAGSTIDGRTIKDGWLKEMADSYDPEEYTAVINAEHYFGNFGSVRELRTQKDKKGRTVLQARVRPNTNYLYQNSQDSRLFFSMEIAHNFAKSGKSYLTGLATTDKPASLGSSEVHFSVQDGVDSGKSISESVEVDMNLFNIEEKESEFKKLFTEMVGTFKNLVTKKDEVDMNKEEFKAFFTEMVTPLTEKINGLESKFKADGDDDGKTAKTAKENAEFATLKSEFAEMLKPLTDKIEALETKFSAPEDGDGKTPGKAPEGKDDEVSGFKKEFTDMITALTTKVDGIATKLEDATDPKKKFTKTPNGSSEDAGKFI